MSSEYTRYDENIAASLLDESVLLDDNDKNKAMFKPEPDYLSNTQDNSDSNEYLDCVSEEESIDEIESYQISDHGSDDDADSSWSDCEIEYDYEPDIYNDEFHASTDDVMMLSNEVKEVIRKYGEDSIFFCGPPELLQLRFRTAILGIVYLCFPTSGGPLESKRSLSAVWGFDPSQPIIVRLRGMMHLFSESATMPLEEGDFCVTVYQGNEPPDSCISQEIQPNYSDEQASNQSSKQGEEKKPDGKDDSSSKNDKNKDEDSDQGSIETNNECTKKTSEMTTTKPKGNNDPPKKKENNQALQEHTALSTFRLGEQIQKISVEFLLSNLRGNGRKKSAVTLPSESSSTETDTKKSCDSHHQECPHCTFVNTEGGATNCFVCKGPLSAQKTSLTDSENGTNTFQKKCEQCNHVNNRKTGECQICAEYLLNSHQSNTDESSTRAREEMLQTYLEKAELGGRGFLARFYAYLNARMPQLHRFCVNCDSPHLDYFGGFNEPIRPSVCRRDFCSWQFTELGVGSASTDELASTAEVVDLLLAITTAAATSPRASKILNPFPLLVKSNGERILDPDQPDYNKARKIISQLPSMQQIVATNNEEDLKKICADRGQHVQSIFRWITSSCTAHLVSLSEDHRLTSMGTRFQFLMHSISPEQERAFAAKKKTHGSIFGFHGSPIENWHSILREGVKNCSGTSLQLHGAAYGNGVYVSPSASQSLGYSRVVRPYNQLGTTSSGASRSENKFISGEQVGILALCEIIDDNTVRKQNNIWVIPNDMHVVTRFLFVFLPLSPDFNDIYSKASQCKTTDPSFQREINAAMENIKGNY